MISIEYLTSDQAQELAFVGKAQESGRQPNRMWLSVVFIFIAGGTIGRAKVEHEQDKGH